jgi:hypothetical protein
MSWDGTAWKGLAWQGTGRSSTDRGVILSLLNLNTYLAHFIEHKLKTPIVAPAPLVAPAPIDAPALIVASSTIVTSNLGKRAIEMSIWELDIGI